MPIMLDPRGYASTRKTSELMDLAPLPDGGKVRWTPRDRNPNANDQWLYVLEPRQKGLSES